MAKRKIVWTQTASKLRRKVLEYWVNRNKSNAYSIKLLLLSDEKAKLIAQNPQLFRHADFPDTRMATMGHFSIFYKYNAKEVIITAFWDNRQDPKKLLQQLKKTK